MTIDSTTKVYLGGVEQVKIIKNGSVIWEKQASGPDYFYIENTYAGSNTVSIYTRISGSPSSSLYSDTVEYSKDKSNWTTLTFTPGNTLTISLNQGEKIYLRNNNGKFNYYDDRNGTGYWLNQISTDHSCVAGGNPSSLLDYTNIGNVSLTTGCFSFLFLNNNNLTDITNISLPSTTLAPYCYLNIFRGTSVTTPISLPATTLAVGCYQSMYEGCTSLTTAPVLPVMTLAPHCYQTMFTGCSSLTTAPVLPATTLESYCYSGMFKNCSSITTSPTLPATTLLQRSYYQMFYGCTLLNEVTTYANDISATDCIKNWLYNVSSTGTFNNFGSATYSSGGSGIPYGWTEHKFKMADVVFTPATGTEYSVTATIKLASSFTWTSATITVSDSDSGAGTRNAYLTFTPSEVSNGVLTTSNNIDLWFQDPDTWFELTVYDNGTLVDTQTNIPYTIQ